MQVAEKRSSPIFFFAIDCSKRGSSRNGTQPRIVLPFGNRNVSWNYDDAFLLSPFRPVAKTV